MDSRDNRVGGRLLSDCRSDDESYRIPQCWRSQKGHDYACDELAAFCTAVAKVRPEGIHGMKASSVKKKMKSKGFAANVSRDDIVRGAADLGVDLNEHIQFVIEAMAGIVGEL